MLECESLLQFKVKIKSWNPTNCYCKLRKSHICKARKDAYNQQSHKLSIS